MKKYEIYLFFGTLFLIGLLIYKDYGLTTDETGARLHGLVTAKYVNKKLNNPFSFLTDAPGIPDLKDFLDRDHSSFTPTLLIFGEIIYGFVHRDFSHFEKVDGYFMKSDIHYLRHLLTFLFFWIGLVFFYLIIQYRWKIRNYSLIATLFLFLSPRIFAESFYNVIDIGLLSLTIIYLYTLIRMLDSLSIFRILSNTCIIGMLVATRIVGVVTIPISLLVFLYHFIYKENKRQILFYTLIFIGLTSLSIIIFWPFLWENPIQNFIFSFKNMSKFRWGGEFILLREICFCFAPSLALSIGLDGNYYSYKLYFTVLFRTFSVRTKYYK